MSKTINLCGIDVPCTSANLLSEFYRFANDNVEIIVYVQGVFPEHAPANNPYAAQAKIDYYDATVDFTGTTFNGHFQMRHRNFDAIRMAYTKFLAETKTKLDNTQACISQFRI